MHEPSKQAMPPPPSSGAGMAIVPDRRPSHRPGGCVSSILFQLFEWNRRFAKKKLFPRKLLPPVRGTKKVTKKLVDERMPVAKFLLIAADENRGGFPNQKKPPEASPTTAPPPATTTTAVRTSGMRYPSLVARLMGLEAMPSLLQDKPRKTVDSSNRHDRSSHPHPSTSRHDLDLDLKATNNGGHGKKDHPRPQKVHKTDGFFDRRRSAANEAASRIGSEVQQLNRTVALSRGSGRKQQQHHKPASPVKSPRILTRKNTARLMGAAVKILEPGLQRRRSALTYRTASQRNVAGDLRSPEKSAGVEGRKYASPCKNCGPSLMEVADRNPRTKDDGQPSVSGLNMNRKQSSQYAQDQCNGSRIQNSSYAIEEKPSSQKNHLTYRKQCARYKQDQCKFIADNSMPTRRALAQQSSTRQTQIISTRSNKTTALPSSRNSSQRRRSELESVIKTCVQSRNTISRPQPKQLPRPPVTSKLGTNQQRNLIQRTRPPKANTQTRSTINAPKPISPTNRTSRNTSASSVVTEARFVIARSRKQAGTGSKGSEMVSFASSAPYRRDSVSDSSSISDRIDKDDEHSSSSASCPPKTATESRAEASQSLDTVRGDELSALLEQKIKELNDLEHDESVSDVGSKSARSTATILQELIMAFTEEGFCETSCSYGCTAEDKMQEGVTGEFAGIGYECDQPSPISILEASFSTDSCLSESLNSMSGQVLNFEATEGSCGKSQDSWDGEADFSDSAAFCNPGKVDADGEWISSCSLDDISLMYNGSRYFGPPDSRHGYVHALISNLELLFGAPNQEEDEDIDETRDSLWVNTLLGTLEMLCAACQTNSWLRSSFPEAKDGSGLEAQLRRFLCDCIIEYLESKYSKFIIVKREKQLSSLNRNNLAEEVLREIGTWKELFSMDLDDMIEEEMNRLPVQWIEFDSEAWETGEEIQQDIFQELVHEAVIELLA